MGDEQQTLPLGRTGDFVFPILKEPSVQLWGSIINRQKVEVYRIHKWHTALEIISIEVIYVLLLGVTNAGWLKKKSYYENFDKYLTIPFQDSHFFISFI